MSLTPGRLIKTDGAPAGGVQTTKDALPFGWADISDSATIGVPISITGGAAPATLTNNASGSPTVFTYLPDGVTSAFWVPGTNSFDFSQLAVGDMIDLRVDLSVTTTAANQELYVDLSMAIGGATPFQIPVISPMQIKSSGTYRVVHPVSFYIGSNDVRTNPARLRFSSPNNASVVVNGWYVRICRRG